MKEWVGIIGVLVGVVVGGAITYITTYLKLRHDERLARNRLYIQKLEEMHQVISTIFDIYRGLFGDAVARLSGTPSNRPKRQDRPLPVDKLRMLIGIYAPNLKNDFERFEVCKKDFGQLLGRSLVTQVEGEQNRKRLVDSLAVKHKEIEKNCIDLQQEIVTLSKKYL